MPDLSPDRLDILLQQFLGAKSLDKHHEMLDQNPEFLTPEFSAALAELAEKQTDAQVRQHLTFLKDMLLNCRDQGIEKTFDELNQQFTSLPNAIAPNMPPELAPILQELNRLIRRTDLPRRVELGR